MSYRISNAIRRRILQIDPAEVLVERRGFRASADVRGHIESVGLSFLDGYNCALRTVVDPGQFCELDSFDIQYRGFAFEGAGMAFALLDSLSLGCRERWKSFERMAGNNHTYVLHVGFGWAIARLPWLKIAPERVLGQFAPLYRWLVIDGFGFHEGYFNAARWIRKPGKQPRLSVYGRRAFDQGLGRSLWFVEGANPARIAKRIMTFNAIRRGDLWSGIGLACAYAGTASDVDLTMLAKFSGEHLTHLQQGVTFGAEARIRGKIEAEHTYKACVAICGMDSTRAAAVTHACRPGVEDLCQQSESELYEIWRAGIRRQFDEARERTT